jgi:HD-GYP domain-containing protein (c-di-GMP phosphodiesterase class II)
MLMDKIEEQVQKLNNETLNHSKRVGFYTYALSKKMGFDRKTSKEIGIAAMTHDLGKKDIDQSILTKYGRLTEEEFDEIKKHPELGHKALLELESQFEPIQFKIMLDVSLNHHERYSGGGYPNGISGSDIPLAANIVSATDLFDALSFKRVYKEAWEEKKLLEHIGDQSGVALNPTVAKTFLDNSDMFYALKNHIGDSQQIDINNFDQEVEDILRNLGTPLNDAKNSIVQKMSTKNDSVAVVADSSIELPEKSASKEAGVELPKGGKPKSTEMELPDADKPADHKGGGGQGNGRKI